MNPLVDSFFLAFNGDPEFAKAVYALAVQNSPVHELEVANLENYQLSLHADLVSAEEVVEVDDSVGIDEEGREGIYSRHAVFTRNTMIKVLTSTGSFKVPAGAIPQGPARQAWIKDTMGDVRSLYWGQALEAMNQYQRAISRYPEFASPDQVKSFNAKFQPIKVAK